MEAHKTQLNLQDENNALRQQLQARDAELQTLRELFARQIAFVGKLQQQIESLQRARFGSKSEKVNFDTLLPFAQEAILALEAQGNATPVAPVQASEETEQDAESEVAKNQPKRKKLPKNLPRTYVIHQPAEANCMCPQCQVMRVKIGEEKIELLAYEPAKVTVIEHIEEKWVCPNQKTGKCNDPITKGKKPPQAIEKSVADASLVAQIAVSKYTDHLPMHRLESIFKRINVDISRSTMCSIALQAAEFLTPLVERMKQNILHSAVIQGDDTPVKQLDRQHEKNIIEARFWIYRGDHEHPRTIFDYQKNRSGEHPRNWFKNTGYRGRLQTDAYSGYNAVLEENLDIVPSGCLAHARRKFFEASQGKGADLRAMQPLSIINRMYKLEQDAREQAGEDLQKLRAIREQLRPTAGKLLWKELRNWLIKNKRTKNSAEIILPQSPLGLACTYLNNQWKKIREPWRKNCGMMDVDNNACERDLRCIALGRKNWLFTGSERGGQAAAIFFSIIVSAKRIHPHINLVAYIEWLLREMPKLRNQVNGGKRGWGDYQADARLDEFMPEVWLKNNPPPMAETPAII